jgi:hypothetical protein
MEFEKPKVTIDLEEYQYLKDQITQLTSERNEDGYYDAARIILFAFSSHNRSVGDIKTYLSQNGVEYFIATNGTRYPSYQDINIHFKPKK